MFAFIICTNLFLKAVIVKQKKRFKRSIRKSMEYRMDMHGINDNIGSAMISNDDRKRLDAMSIESNESNSMNTDRQKINTSGNDKNNWNTKDIEISRCRFV